MNCLAETLAYEGSPLAAIGLTFDLTELQCESTQVSWVAQTLSLDVLRARLGLRFRR
jgi:hypothetical protein